MMINYPILRDLTLLLFELWLLLTVVILLHRFSHRTGQAPLIILLGGLTAGLQARTMGSITIDSGNLFLQISIGSYVLIPAILTGLLLIYITQGTIRMRSALLGVVTLSFVVAFYILGSQSIAGQLGNQFQPMEFDAVTIRTILASIVTLLVDLLIMTVTYQLISNLWDDHPNATASLAAILLGMWVDALLYPFLAYFGDPSWRANLAIHTIGKTISAVAVWPVLAMYISRVTPVLPETAANVPRPAFDIFLRTVSIEARARFHHSLLITISKIHQLILTSDSTDSLLQETCEILVERRDYEHITIAMPGYDPAKLEPTYQSSMENTPFLSSLFNDSDSPPVRAWYTGEPQIYTQIGMRIPTEQDPFHNHQIDCQSMICLPMIHSKNTYGVIVLCNNQPAVLPELEMEWLQIIANDLAYAISSLKEHHNRILLQAAVETLQEGLLIMGTNGTIEYANQAIEKLIGFPRSALIGENSRMLYPSNFPQNKLQEYQLTLNETGSLRTEYEYNHPDGYPVYTDLTATLVRHDREGVRHYAASFHDITNQRLYENQLLTLHQLTTELVQIHDPETLYRTILESSEQLLNADASIIFFTGSDEYTITQSFNHNVDPAYAQRISTSYQGLPGDEAAKTSHPVTVRDTLDTTEYGDRTHFMAEYGIRALMILPILYQGKRIGALTVYYQKPHSFSENQKQLGLILAQTLAIIVENTRLYQAELKQSQFSEALSQAAIVLNSSLELSKVLDLILEQTMRVVPCRAVNIMFIEDDQLTLAGQRGYGDDLQTIHQLIQDVNWKLTPSLAKMKNTRQPIIISDTNQAEGWVNLPSTEWIRSYAAAPLIIDAKTVGFLNVDSDKQGQFTEKTLEKLKAFAAHVSIAVQNARLYQELQEYADSLKASVDARTNQLQEAERALDGILSSVPDAVFLLDTGNQILQANQAAEQLRHQANQQNIRLFSTVFLERVEMDNTPSEDKIIDIGKRSYQAISSRIYNEKEQRVGQIIIFRDVTRFRELDQLKSKFVSDVSHELRTPLTNMTLYLGLLSMAKNQKQRDRYMETLQRETDRLTDLIEDLLAISRLEAGRVEITLQYVDANMLLTDLVNDRSILASQKRIRLLFRKERKLPKVTADSRLLTQAISNLITNAIHYTPEKGKILVRTQSQERDGRKYVTVCVNDNGVGISRDELQLIFDRFYRGEASQKTEAPGTGLGLAIAQEIVSQFHGFIEVESTLGKGSRFTVWIPTVIEPGML